MNLFYKHYFNLDPCHLSIVCNTLQMHDALVTNGVITSWVNSMSETISISFPNISKFLYPSYGHGDMQIKIYTRIKRVW